MEKAYVIICSRTPEYYIHESFISVHKTKEGAEIKKKELESEIDEDDKSYPEYNIQETDLLD